MRELSDERRHRDRERLMRALKDVQSGKAPGLFQGEAGPIKEQLLLRIAEINRILGFSPVEVNMASLSDLRDLTQ